MKTSSCFAFAILVGACATDPPEPTLDLDDLSIEQHAHEGLVTTEPTEETCLAEEVLRADTQEVCGGKCQTQDNSGDARGCKDVTGPALQTCLEGLCASAKAAHEAAWPDGPPACPATKGECASPIQPEVKGTCTKQFEGSWGETGWVIDGCTIGDSSLGGYAAYFGSWCTYKCIKNPTDPAPPPHHVERL